MELNEIVKKDEKFPINLEEAHAVRESSPKEMTFWDYSCLIFRSLKLNSFLHI